MFSKNDIQSKNIIFVNILDGVKLNMSLGNIVIKDKKTDEVKTKVSYHKVFALFVIGNMSITSQLIESCKKHGVQLIFLKQNFRPYLSFGDIAEANYLLRYKQYHFSNDLDLARVIIGNKLFNQISTMKKIRNKSEEVQELIKKSDFLATKLKDIGSLSEMMGIEGNIAKNYFKVYLSHLDGWSGRKPRIKQDPYNVVLDIGYTMLFNFVECFLRLFGFDLYKGFCHQTWYKRKSLICDFVEPFRCIVDSQVRKSWNLKQFKKEDFGFKNAQYFLGRESSKAYSKILFTEISSYKLQIFEYVRKFYRAFMAEKALEEYPVFLYNKDS